MSSFLKCNQLSGSVELYRVATSSGWLEQQLTLATKLGQWMGPLCVNFSISVLEIESENMKIDR